MERAPQTYEQVQEMIERTQKTLQNTLASVDRSLQQCRTAITDARDANQKIDDFKESYKRVISKLAEQIAPTFSQPAFLDQQNTSYGVPVTSTVQKISALLKTKKNIVFLTGAGISLASGIPTYRGAGSVSGFSVGNMSYVNEEVARYSFMKSNPDVFWERHQHFYELCKKSKPNAAHHAVAQMQQYFSKSAQSVTLITQNIDNLHVQAYLELSQKNKKQEPEKTYGYCSEVFEIHGNLNYVRCDKLCSKELQPYQYVQKKYSAPICQFCKIEEARPNVLYFDESYIEDFYRKETINKRTEDMDCIVIVGTTLATGFAAQLVSRAVKNAIDIVEVSVEPVVKAGKAHRLTGKAEQILPELAAELCKK